MVKEYEPIPLDHDTKACLRLWASVFHNGLVHAAQAWMAKSYDDNYPHPDVVWFDSNEAHPGSFSWLCDLFNLDTERARSMARMQFRKLARSGRNAIKASKKKGAILAQKTSESASGLSEPDEEGQYFSTVADVPLDLGILDLLSGGNVRS